MNASSTDILTLIEASTDLVAGTDLFISKEPDSPDNCVTVYDRTGGLIDLDLDKVHGMRRSSVQVRIRNKSYQNGFAQAEDIVELLHGAEPQNINGTYYNLIQCANEPQFLAYDDNDRVIIIANFNITRR
jgi:hypothetical protein